MWLLGSKFTVGVCAVVLNDRQEILLLRHRFRESQKWELPGGFVRRGESFEAAVQRELLEETGIDIEILMPGRTYIEQPLHIDVSFLARYKSGKLVPDEREILDAHFFPVDQLPSELSAAQAATLSHALPLQDRAMEA